MTLRRRLGWGDAGIAEPIQQRTVRLILAAVAAFTGSLVVGCGGSHHPTADAKTTTAAPVATSTLPADQATVVAAWRHYWDTYIAVASEMRLPDPRLAQVATGQELQTLGSGFLAYESQGEVFRGTIDIDPKVTSIQGGIATLRDCYFSHILGYKNDQPVGPPDTQRRLVTVTLAMDGGVWKVSAIRHEGDGCTGP